MNMHRLHRRGKAGSRGLRWWWTFAAALVLASALIVAIAQNSAVVRARAH